MSDNNDVFAQLEQVITQRLAQPSSTSYVAKLQQQGLDSILKKIGEEATEVVIAAKTTAADDENAAKNAVIYESCDLIFHLMVLLGHKGIRIDDIRAELERRFGTSGIAEKASRKTVG